MRHDCTCHIGTALQLLTKSPGYESPDAADTPYVDVSGVHNEEENMLTFFLVNRHPSESIDAEASLQGFAGGTIVDHQVMTHESLKAVNTGKKQDEVAPRKGSGAKLADGKLSVSLPPYSYQMVRVKL